MTETTAFVPPADSYYSRERAQQEWDHLWTRTWQIGPREEEIPEAGDIFIHSLGDESLLFVRQDDGSVAGFFNVCRHRGNRLLLGPDGPAFAPKFTCAFHGWQFGLDGALGEVPYRERFDAATLNDPACTSLRRFRVDSFAGWLWFNLDEDAIDLTEYLGPITRHLTGYRMEQASIVDYKTIEFACNWKTVNDAFNESYHFQTLHPEVLAWGNEDAPIRLMGLHSYMVNEYGRPSKLYPDHERLNPPLEALLSASGINPATFTGTADDVRAAVQAAKRQAGEAGGTPFPYASLSDSQLSDAWHFALFPAAHFNLFPEFFVLMRYRPHPSGDPERMYFDFIMCAPLAEGEQVPEYEHRIVPGGAEPVGDILQWGVRQHPIVNEVLGQDVGLVEHVQAGQRSRSFEGAILSEDERRIAHVHANIDALIRGQSITDLIAANPLEAETD